MLSASHIELNAAEELDSPILSFKCFTPYFSKASAKVNTFEHDSIANSCSISPTSIWRPSNMYIDIAYKCGFSINNSCIYSAFLPPLVPFNLL